MTATRPRAIGTTARPERAIASADRADAGPGESGRRRARRPGDEAAPRHEPRPRSRRRRGSASPRRSRGASGSAAGPTSRRSSLPTASPSPRPLVAGHAEDDRVLDRRDLLDTARTGGRGAIRREPVPPMSPATPLRFAGTTTSRHPAPPCPLRSRPGPRGSRTARPGASPRTSSTDRRSGHEADPPEDERPVVGVLERVVGVDPAVDPDVRATAAPRPAGSPRRPSRPASPRAAGRRGSAARTSAA